MTEDELKAIEDRAAKALRGPWQAAKVKLEPNEHGKAAGLTNARTDYELHTAWDHPQLGGPATVVSLAYGLYGTHVHIKPENAEFLAHAREDVPALVAEVRRLRVQQLELLRLVEKHTLPRCFACGSQLLSQPHRPDCELVALLGREPQR